MVAAAVVRKNFSDSLFKVRQGGRLVITLNNKPVAALVPVDDYRLIQEMEDALDHKLMDAEKKKARGKRIRITGPVDEYLASL